MAERAWIVTGYDGSDNSRDGLALASLLATTLDCGVVAASILTFAPTEATWSEYERVLRAEEQRLEAEAARRSAPSNASRRSASRARARRASCTTSPSAAKQP